MLKTIFIMAVSLVTVMALLTYLAIKNADRKNARKNLRPNTKPPTPPIYLKLTQFLGDINASLSYLTSSKIGGKAFFPISLKYPTDPNGQKMGLICQINLKDLPPTNMLPTEGLLQMYLTCEPLAVELDSRYNRCIYISKESLALPSIDIDEIPLIAHSVSAEYSVKLITTKQGNSPQLFGNSKYPDSSLDANKILLLEIPTNNKDILWGDFGDGIGQFFIDLKDLGDRNFNEVEFSIVVP